MTEKRFFSELEMAAFRRDGFVAAYGLFDAAEMRRIAAWTEEVQAWPEVPGEHMKYFEESLVEPGKKVLNRLENFYPYHSGFAALFDGDKLKGRISELLGEPAVLFKEKINFKLPGGDGFKPHQDQQAGWSTYAPFFITVLVSIDESTGDNGCLEIAAGHHKAGLVGAEWAPLTEDQMAEMDFKPFPTKSGDALFFDSFVPHGSRANLTNESRRVLYITYNTVSQGDHRVQHYVDKRKSYPPDIERIAGKTYAYRV